MDSVTFLSSELLTTAGITHGWFMRFGGVSSGSYESLNGKKGMSDSDENVAVNRSRALTTLTKKRSNLSGAESVAHIVHSFKDNILVATKAGEFTGFDASLSSSIEVILSQTTADCATVIIGSDDGSVVALVHGSWHTLAAQIIHKTVLKLKEQTERPLIAGIGPMICRECYEFGAEADQLFDAKYLTPKDEKYLVDLKQMAVDQLQSSGVNKVDDLHICTFEDERFFSARRDGRQSGRIITLATTATDVV